MFMQLPMTRVSTSRYRTASRNHSSIKRKKNRSTGNTHPYQVHCRRLKKCQQVIRLKTWSNETNTKCENKHERKILNTCSACPEAQRETAQGCSQAVAHCKQDPQRASRFDRKVTPNADLSSNHRRRQCSVHTSGPAVQDP